MKSLFLVALAVGMALIAPERATAQNVPDLSGTWTFNPDISAIPAANGPGNAFGGLIAGNGGRYAPMTVLVINQTATEVSIEGEAYQQRFPRVVYKLDGSETKHVGDDGTTTGTAAWQGASLVINSVRAFDGPQGNYEVRTKDIYTMNNGVLMLERVQQAGQQGRIIDGRFAYTKGAAPVVATPTKAAAPGACPTTPLLFGPCAEAKARSFKPPRTKDGKPDLQGYWAATGALTGVAPGFGIEEQQPSFGFGGGNSLIVDPADGKLPYQPWALAERERRRLPEHALEDPQVHCMNAGTPRQMTFLPFQIVRAEDHYLVLHEVSHSYRMIAMDGRAHLPETFKLWQGDSVGHWEGDTLVVETTNNNGMTYLDLAHNFLSAAQRVTERFTLIDPDTIHYTATVEDPSVFTRPFTMAIPLVRQMEKGYEIFESACHEENQDLVYIGRAIEQMKAK